MAYLEIGSTEGNVFLFFRGDETVYEGDLLAGLGWEDEMPDGAIPEPMDQSSVYRVRICLRLENGRAARVWCKYNSLEGALGGVLEGSNYKGVAIVGTYLPGRTLVRR